MNTNRWEGWSRGRLRRLLTLGTLALALVGATVMSPGPTYADASKDPRPPVTTPRPQPPAKAKIAPTGLPALKGGQGNAQQGVTAQALTILPDESVSISVDRTFYPLYSPVRVCYNLGSPAYVSIWDYVTGQWLIYDQYMTSGSCFGAYATPPAGWDYLYIYAEYYYTGHTAYNFSDWFYVY